MRLPPEWPEPVRVAVALALLMGVTYILRPKELATFVRDILDALDVVEDARS